MRANKDDIAIMIIVGIAVLIILAIVAAKIYVAYHFITKYW